MNKNLWIRALFLLIGVLCYGAAAAVNISGTAWIDADNDGIVDAGETGTNFGGTMYVNVVNASGAVIASTQVGPAGGYSFTGLPNNLTGHKLVLTNTPTNPKGNRIPGTYYVAEDVVGASNTANQANAPLLGEIALTNQTGNMQNQNFRMGQQTSFGCLDGIAYQIAIASGQTESSLYSYNVSSGTRTQIGGITPYNLNSLIYSTAADNFLWATVTNSNDIARIGAGAGTVVYDIQNLPSVSYNVGVELPNAYMLVYTSNATEFYVIDVDPSRPTFLELVDPANGYAAKTGAPYGTSVSAGFNSSDIAYLASTGLGYGITPSSNITTLNPVTGVVTTNATPVAGLPNAAYGGMFSDKAGKLYAFNNATGGFYRIDPVANTATLLSTSPPSGGNDAASCPNAFVECDTDIPVVPADVTLCPGNSTTFTVAPEGNGPFTYQWQQSTNGGGSWANLQTTPFTGPNGTYSGGGTATLTVTPTTTAWNNYRYRCVITSNLCTTNSSSATMNVFAIPGSPALVASTDAPICPATTYDLNRLVAGPAPTGSTLRFYTSATPSAATLVADPTQAPAGTYYARYENDGCSGPVSQPITITGCLTPFTCEDGVAYQVAAANGEPVSTLYAYNVVTGTRTQIAPLNTTVNSLIYSEIDNTLWATKNGTNSIVRIAADGTLLEYPIANLPTNFNVGTGLPGGYMLVYSSNQPRYYVIDINPARSTYLRLVDPANSYALQTGPTYGNALSAAINVADLVYEPVTGLVYGVETTTARLVTLNHVTGATTVGAVVAGLPTNTTFGAVFADPSGKLYAFANDPGTFHRINPTAATSTLLSTSITSNSNDGASCPNSILENLPFDCADGITYQVAAADGEPVSTLYAYNVSTGARTEIAPLPMTVNSLIYNSADNMLWATKNGTNSIVQIDREGGTVEYPIANLPAAGGFNVGVELPNGYMMVYQTNQPSFYVIDVDPNRPSTYLKLVDPTNGFAVQAGPTYGVPVSAPFGAFDFAYLPSTQLMYGFNADGRITTLNPLTGEVAVGEVIAGLPANNGGFGAVFADATGKLYAFHNNTGRFYKIDPVNNSASFMSTSVPSNSNDGANCVTATLCDIELTQPDPQMQTTQVGISASFTVDATGTGTLSYQWQVSADGGTTWTNLAPGGATDANGTYSGAATDSLSLTPFTTAWDGYQYRVIVDSDSDICTLTSAVGTLFVKPLPVTLVSFRVKKEGNGAKGIALLNWATTEETNSDRFEIERSTDARHWTTIGIKASHGESNTLKQYDFVDNAPAEGINYYRLKMVDKDATFAYSSIQDTKFEASGLLAAYPNPATDRLKFKNFTNVKSVVLHNAAGVKVLDRKSVTSEGLDISKLAPGVYSVKLILTDGSESVQKIVIVR
ncbi:T9SS type A sorting domain-containing protein [Dyadobacter sp. 676]|uniref:T9SS type A sorting domain-containing protein n=1 Tax=Dyadobacter sp. 676 TaxID=3088362 RepID=A0AAU8FHP0_9BACT